VVICPNSTFFFFRTRRLIFFIRNFPSPPGGIIILTSIFLQWTCFKSSKILQLLCKVCHTTDFFDTTFYSTTDTLGRRVFPENYLDWNLDILKVSFGKQPTPVVLFLDRCHVFPWEKVYSQHKSDREFICFLSSRSKMTYAVMDAFMCQEKQAEAIDSLSSLN